MSCSMERLYIVYRLPSRSNDQRCMYNPVAIYFPFLQQQLHCIESSTAILLKMEFLVSTQVTGAIFWSLAAVSRGRVRGSEENPELVSVCPTN